MKLVQFDGKVSSWDEWSFSFKRHVKQMSGTAYTAMSQTEIQDQPVLEVDNTEEQQRLSADLYDLLCQMISGEALSVVRSVVDCEGFRAWQVLAKKYQPKTIATHVQLMCEIASAKKIVFMKDVEVAVNHWEEKVRKLASRWNEKLSDSMKMALFVNMMPSSIQYFIFTHITKDMTYGEMKERVLAMVTNKVATMSGPAPMDTSGVDTNPQEQGGDEQPDEDDHWGWGVQGLNNQCNRCGGEGHWARECPSKGKGKGKGNGNDQETKVQARASMPKDMGKDQEIKAQARDSQPKARARGRGSKEIISVVASLGTVRASADRQQLFGKKVQKERRCQWTQCGKWEQFGQKEP
jgi:hypothetical protein